MVPSALLGMRAQGHTTLALAHARDPQADDGAQRPGRQPCGLREPHGGAGRRGLAPTSTRCSGGLLVLRGLEQGCIHAPRRGACRGAACPPVVLRGMTQARDLADHAGARGGGASAARAVLDGRGACGAWRRRCQSGPWATARGAAGARGVPSPSPQLQRWRWQQQAARRRKTPKTKGKGATGGICWTAMAVRHLLVETAHDRLLAEGRLRA